MNSVVRYIKDFLKETKDEEYDPSRRLFLKKAVVAGASTLAIAKAAEMIVPKRKIIDMIPLDPNVMYEEYKRSSLIGFEDANGMYTTDISIWCNGQKLHTGDFTTLSDGTMGVVTKADPTTIRILTTSSATYDVSYTMAATEVMARQEEAIVRHSYGRSPVQAITDSINEIRMRKLDEVAKLWTPGA